MIPYEDLVIALQTWRAKQGLPVGQLSGALSPPHELTASSMAPSGPPAPPPPKQAFLGSAATPPPLAAPIDDSLDVDDASLIEEAHYENEGDDFAMNFPAGQHLNEDATAIGGSPTPRPSDNTLDDGTEVASSSGALPRTGRNEDW